MKKENYIKKAVSLIIALIILNFAIITISGSIQTNDPSSSKLILKSNDLIDVMTQGLKNELIIEKLEQYLGEKLEIAKTKSSSESSINSLYVSRSVETINNKSNVTITILNVGNAPLENVYLFEAVPISIINDVHELKEFYPRHYDIIINEKINIQWNLKPIQTSIIAWRLGTIEDDYTISYNINKKITANDMGPPIIIQTITVIDEEPTIEEPLPTEDEKPIFYDITTKGISENAIDVVPTTNLWWYAIIGIIAGALTLGYYIKPPTVSQAHRKAQLQHKQADLLHTMGELTKSQAMHSKANKLYVQVSRMRKK